jgi:hypothetical protein
MSEQEWHNTTNVHSLLTFALGTPDANWRKERLLAAAFCRLFGDDIAPASLPILIESEVLADGSSPAVTSYDLCNRANALVTVAAPGRQESCAKAICYAVLPEVWGAAGYRSPSLHDAEPEANCIRGIFGNPFRSIAVDPSWLTTDVRILAESIYADRAFDRMPILADALQDAGCDNEDILNHCRQPGEHVRGCWVVDLLTGRK